MTHPKKTTSFGQRREKFDIKTIKTEQRKMHLLKNLNNSHDRANFSRCDVAFQRAHCSAHWAANLILQPKLVKNRNILAFSWPTLYCYATRLVTKGEGPFFTCVSSHMALFIGLQSKRSILCDARFVITPSSSFMRQTLHDSRKNLLLVSKKKIRSSLLHYYISRISCSYLPFHMSLLLLHHFLCM